VVAVLAAAAVVIVVGGGGGGVVVAAAAAVVVVVVKAIPVSLDRPRGCHEFEAPRFLDNRYMKVVRLSALRAGRLSPPGSIPDIHFC